MGIALFDLDRTLIDVNSASLWVKHEWRGGRLSTLDALRGGWWVMRYHMGHDAGMDEVYREAVRRLAGQDETEMAERTLQWFADEVASHIRPGALAALDAHRAVGDRLVVATSSSPYAARAARDAWGLHDIIHTSFEVRDGKFTGEIDGFAYGDTKYDRAVEWAAQEGEDLSQAAFYTDSVTDLKLMENVANPVAVNPDKPLRRIATDRGWPVVDWGRAG
ncbi:MAG: HAD superfamily hydrolase (TIGR01490 family) [Myxococcota bacterium]|jgi:HAD superfamily hydrolase (TIGR01490 family)